MLVPFLDIANHSSSPNCIYSLGQLNLSNVIPPINFSEKDCGSIYLTASERIKPNEQIFISYGRKKGDHELLSTYGFCLPPLENKNTRILISPGKFHQSLRSQICVWVRFETRTSGLTQIDKGLFLLGDIPRLEPRVSARLKIG